MPVDGRVRRPLERRPRMMRHACRSKKSTMRRRKPTNLQRKNISRTTVAEPRRLRDPAIDRFDRYAVTTTERVPGCAVRAFSARSRAVKEVLHLWQPEP